MSVVESGAHCIVVGGGNGEGLNGGSSLVVATQMKSDVASCLLKVCDRYILMIDG